jgi:hypothetical protein
MEEVYNLIKVLVLSNVYSFKFVHNVQTSNAQRRQWRVD